MINDKYMEFVKKEHKESYLLYNMNRLHNRMVAFSSHQPVLIHLLNTITEGEVLEFGTGWNSTPIMHLICGFQNRHLTSIETDAKWADKFKEYNTEWHSVVLADVKSVETGEHPLLKKKYSIIFVDGAPAEIRQPFLEKMKDHGDYIIVHDSECVVQGVKNCYAYDFSMFKHVFHFSPVVPATSILSNLEVIDERILACLNRN